MKSVEQEMRTYIGSETEERERKHNNKMRNENDKHGVRNA